jgi:hypothetical protein
MSKIKLTGHASGTGVLNVAAPNTSTDRTITLPDATGTLLTEVADDSITLAKMASGTDGNIISYDASGNPVAVATGSDGQVLTSTGAGSPPAFETPAGGGKILQVVANHVTTTNNHNGTSFEATFLTGSITPSATSSKIWFLANCPVMKNGYDGNVQFKWYRKIGSGSWTEYAVAGYTGDTNSTNWETSWLSSNLLDSPNTTSEVSYKLYIRLSGSGLVYLNSGEGKVGVTLLEVDGS